MDKEKGEPNFRAVVQALQEYAVDRKIRVAALDWYMLAFGGQTEAAAFLAKRFCSGPDPCAMAACPIAKDRLCIDFEKFS